MLYRLIWTKLVLEQYLDVNIISPSLGKKLFNAINFLKVFCIILHEWNQIWTLCCSSNSWQGDCLKMFFFQTEKIESRRVQRGQLLFEKVKSPPSATINTTAAANNDNNNNINIKCHCVAICIAKSVFPYLVFFGSNWAY